MKKLFIFGQNLLWIFLLAVGMTACTEQNTPDNPNGEENQSTETPDDTTIVTTDTIRIVWNGTNVTIEGEHNDVSVTDENGYVTVNSTVKDITYVLSGNGQGQLTIYGTNRHQLILSDLTLTCSDGPAINNQCKKSCFIMLQGSNTLTDGSAYATSTEDRKAAFYSEGQMIFSGGGSLIVTGNYKHAIASDDYIQFAESTGSLTIHAKVNDGIHANDGIFINGGTFAITSKDEGIRTDSNTIAITGGVISVISQSEGIESKGTITISGGIVYSQASDDAINAGGDLTISGGCVCAYSTGNDGIDANGNCYVQGGLIYATGSRSPEVAIDANTEKGYKLYVTGGTIVAVGNLESGAQLTQSCYKASGSTNTWYALTAGDEVFAFKTPGSNASTIVVSGAEQPTLTKGVSASGTEIFNGIGYYPATFTGGSSVSLSTYNNNSGGGPGGGGPGGGGPGGW